MTTNEPGWSLDDVAVNKSDLVAYYEGLARDYPEQAKHWMREAERAREHS